jgi:hypothetical protein
MTQEGLVDAADCIATYAEFTSYQKDIVVPFTVGAVEAGRSKRKYMKGKKDDITVIVS